MAYVIFGGLLTILELYRLVLHRTHTFEVPLVLRIGIPLLLFLGGFWRVRVQWPAVVLTAFCRPRPEWRAVAERIDRNRAHSIQHPVLGVGWLQPAKGTDTASRTLVSRRGDDVGVCGRVDTSSSVVRLRSRRVGLRA